MSTGSANLKFADAKNRFSTRVADYVRYRPRYPQGVLDLMQLECQLTPAHAIADIGSGTGFLAELFLKNGNTVFGVEPNKEMREAGEQYLDCYSRFNSVDGSAEATTLGDSSVHSSPPARLFTGSNRWPRAANSRAFFVLRLGRDRLERSQHGGR